MRKKLFAVIMSVMMMVTFMPMMAFADPVDVTDIQWSTDKSYATVTAGSSTFKVYAKYDANQGAYGAWSLMNPADTSKFNGYSTTYNTGSVSDKLYLNAVNIDAECLTLDDGYSSLDASGAATVDAGLYSIAYEASSNAPTGYTVTKVTFATEELNPATDYTVTYPEYKAYDYTAATATTPAADKFGNIVVELTSVGKENLRWKLADQNLYFYNTKVEQKVIFAVDEFGEEYLDLDVLNAPKDYAENEFNYDGNEYQVGMTHTALNSTVSYAVKYCPVEDVATHDEITEYEKPFVATDYTSTLPTIKDAGKYKVSFNLSFTKKDGSIMSYTDSEEFIIDQRYIVVLPKASLVKEYDGKGFVLENKYFTIADERIDDEYRAYGLIPGDSIFQDVELTDSEVGSYKIYRYEMKLVENPNYDINYDVTRLDDPLLGLTATIAKSSSNKVTFTTTSKTYKAKTLKKGAKSFAVANAKFGKLVLKKVSGNKNLKVKSGKVVVKKGLKKGTYKIKVKAYANATTNFVKAPTVTKTIKVKVK